MNVDYLRGKPDYLEILESAIDWEENNHNPNHPFVDDKEYDASWTSKEIKHHPSKVYQLEVNGFIERVFDSNSTTAYSLVDRERIKEIVDELKTQGYDSDGHVEREVMHEFPDHDNLEGLFDNIIGYDDVKWLFKRAITSPNITNILLVGPPGSAKTVFLREITRNLEGAVFMSGKPSSGPGVIDKMFSETPKFMLIDEMDDMNSDTQEVLSQYTETGIVDETKMGKDRMLKTNTKTFASANDIDGIAEHIENRFLDIYFEEYDRDEFIEICTHLLPREEDVDDEEATKIAELLWDMNGSADIRKAIQVARMSRGDPERVISVLDNYSSKNGLVSKL